MFGGTHDKPYEKFSDSQVAMVQGLLNFSGFSHSEGEMRDVSWKEGNDNAFIPFGNIVNGGFGFTVATPVFMNGYDKSTDAFVFGNTFAKVEEMNGTPDYVLGRYLNFASAKGAFYSSISALIKGDSYIVERGGYQEKVPGRYENYGNLHFGIDIGTHNKNLDILSGISGTVIASGYDEARGYGNFVQIEYGYQFEGFTYQTGIIGEYAHMKDAPLVAKGQFVAAGTQLGFVGTTGTSTGEHLHYSVYTAPGKSYAASVMLNIFGKDYAGTAMTNKPPNDAPSSKTVYDPTVFYYRYKNKY
jgi:murein DD-endopeptidase MepM/ murein hydrolase activator NlpD